MGSAQSIWVDVCAVDDIPLRGSRIVKTPFGCIALFRTYEGKVFALKDECPHKKGPLSQGIVHGHAVTCPLHNWVISLETGKATGEEGATSIFKTLIQDGRIQLQLSG